MLQYFAFLVINLLGLSVAAISCDVETGAGAENSKDDGCKKVHVLVGRKNV